MSIPGMVEGLFVPGDLLFLDVTVNVTDARSPRWPRSLLDIIQHETSSNRHHEECSPRLAASDVSRRTASVTGTLTTCAPSPPSR